MAFFILTEFFSSLISFISPTSFLLFSSSSSSFAASYHLVSSLSFFFSSTYYASLVISLILNFIHHSNQDGYVILTFLAVIFSRPHMYVK